MPKAHADYLILRDIRAPGDDAVAVTNEEMRVASDEVGSPEGLFVCPEEFGLCRGEKSCGRRQARSEIEGHAFQYRNRIRIHLSREDGASKSAGTSFQLRQNPFGHSRGFSGSRTTFCRTGAAGPAI